MRAQPKTSTNATWLLIVFVLVLGATGAAVFLLLEDGDPAPSGPSLIASERTDPSGKPSMVLDLPESGPSPIVMKVPDPPRVDMTPVLDVADGTPRSRIVGRVVDAKRQPVAGATIEVFRGNSLITTNFPGTRQRVDVTATSEADGSFELVGVPVGKDYVVVAEHLDYAPGEVTNLRVAHDRPLEGILVMLTEGANVSGYVLTMGGSPIAAARVELYDSVMNSQQLPEDRRPWRIVLTDGTGAFLFEHVSATSLRVRVEADGYESQLKMVSYALEVRPKDEILTFRLSEGFSLHGRVIDERGGGIAQARLEATSLTKDYQGNAIAFSDGAGYFVLDGMGEVPYQLRCTATGFSDAVRPKVLVSGGEYLIEMQRRLSATGWVKRRNGEPASDFSLALMRAVPGRDPALMNDVRTFRSADGSFEFDNLDPGSFALEARVKGFAPARSEPILLARDGSTPPPVVIVVSRGATLSGRVVDPQGKSVKGALVKVNENGHIESPILQLFGQLSPGSERKVQVRTGADGSFSIENIMPDTYQVRVDHDDWAPLIVNDITLFDEDDAANAPLELRMPMGATIAGRALDAGRRPMPLTEVQISNKSGWSEAVTTDDLGRYAFTNLIEGDYMLSVKPGRDALTGEQMNPLMILLHAKQSRRDVFVAQGQIISDFELQLTGDL